MMGEHQQLLAHSYLNLEQLSTISEFIRFIDFNSTSFDYSYYLIQIDFARILSLMEEMKLMKFE
jgi:hypothetical protein